jgi:hypothetical protein
MIVSATQFDTFLLCPRKWYGLKVIKLPELPKGHFEYGEVQHEVAERFLGSTLSGRVPEKPTGALAGQTPGETTELYPEGWQKTLSYGEAQHIADTTQLAIEKGVLVRKPGSFVEMGYRLPFVDDIVVMGFLDHCYPWVVEDHKTTKSIKYAATDKTVAKKLPMRLYAWALAESLPGEAPAEITVKHNIFRKDIVDVREAEATIPTIEVYEYADFLRDTALEMKSITEGIKDFLDAPGPLEKSACQAFGGCPFQKICGKHVTVELYIEHTSRLQTKTVEGPKGIFGALPKKDMGSLEERLAKFKAAAEAKKAPVPEEEPDGAMEMESAIGTVRLDSVETEAPEYPTPPWVYDKCTACGGIGWNSKSNPCKICQNMTKINANALTITRLTDETVQWEGDIGVGICYGPHGGLPVPEPESPPAVSAEDTTPTTDSAPAPVSEAPAPAPASEPEPTPIIDASKVVAGKRGRPKKMFTLALNCLPVRGPAKIQHLDVIFKGLIEQFNKDSKTPYYSTNAFERRDMFAAVAEEVADELGTDILFACPDSPDTRALVDALRPYATVVWAPMGQTVTVVGE